MNFFLILTLLLSVVCGCQIFQSRGLDTKFIQEDAKLYFNVTNNSDKDIILENLSGGVKFTKTLRTDGVIVDVEGPYESKSISHPQFMIATKEPIILGVGKSHKFNISIYRPPAENETAKIHVLLIGKDLKINKSIEVKNE